MALRSTLSAVVVIALAAGCAERPEFEYPGETEYARGPAPSVEIQLPERLPMDVRMDAERALWRTTAQQAVLEALAKDAARLRVDVDGTTAVLTGVVSDEDSRAAAVRAVEGVAGIETVRNELRIGTVEVGRSDPLLEVRVQRRLLEELGDAAAWLEVRSLGAGQVSVRGPVPDYTYDRPRILATAASTPGVRRVVDLVAVGREAGHERERP